MSYAQRKELSGNRTMAIILVAILQLGLGYAIVTGLAYNVIKKAAQDLKTFDVEEPPPPTIQTVVATPPPYIPPVAPSPPPPPPAPRKVQSAQSAKGDLRSLFSADDYPASASAAEASGTAQATLTIGPDGRVVGCNLIRSTGNGALDSATCNILRRRAKFTPARDSNGQSTTDTVTTPPIVWRLEG